MIGKQKRMYGVIHIGSVGLSLLIVDYGGPDDVTIVQEARRAAGFGEEVFTQGELSFTSIRQMVRIINGFRRIMADYEVEEVMVYATAVLREAKNSRMILDLIRVHTGLSVEILDMPQEIFYKHYALHYELTHNADVAAGTTLYVDITSSAVGLTIWQKDTLKYQQNLHIGTLRVLESFRRAQRDSYDFPKVLDEFLGRILEPIWPMLEQYEIDKVVLSGRESRLVARMMGFTTQQAMRIVSPERFFRVFQSSQSQTSTSLEHAYGFTADETEKLLPTLHLYAQIFTHVQPQRLLMMSTTFLYGAMLYYGARTTDEPALAFLREQHLELAKTMAARYGGNIMHGETVAEYVVILMKALRSVHGLGERDTYLLRMAVFLHQIGRFVNLRQNGVHTYHIIMGTDLFGLTDLEKEMVAVVAYYNYKGRPSDEDKPFRQLPEWVKMVILKLVAVLRLAKAMDKGEQHKLYNVEAFLRRGSLVIYYDAKANTNTLLEEWTFAEETKLFTDVFGLDAKLERRPQ